MCKHMEESQSAQNCLQRLTQVLALPVIMKHMLSHGRNVQQIAFDQVLIAEALLAALQLQVT